MGGSGGQQGDLQEAQAQVERLTAQLASQQRQTEQVCRACLYCSCLNVPASAGVLASQYVYGPTQRHCRLVQSCIYMLPFLHVCYLSCIYATFFTLFLAALSVATCPSMVCCILKSQRLLFYLHALSQLSAM